MNKILVQKTILNPSANAGVLTMEETAEAGSYISIDPSKTVYPRGRLSFTTGMTHSAKVSRGVARTSIPCLALDGLSEAAVTVHTVVTTERGALKGGRIAVEGGAVVDCAEGALMVALRLNALATLSALSSAENITGEAVAIDALANNDPTGLMDTSAVTRFSNPFVRAQNGLPMIGRETLGSADGQGAPTLIAQQA